MRPRRISPRGGVEQSPTWPGTRPRLPRGSARFLRPKRGDANALAIHSAASLASSKVIAGPSPEDRRAHRRPRARRTTRRPETAPKIFDILALARLLSWTALRPRPAPVAPSNAAAFHLQGVGELTASQHHHPASSLRRVPQPVCRDTEYQAANQPAPDNTPQVPDDG